MKKYCSNCKFECGWGDEYSSPYCNAWFCHPDLAIIERDPRGRTRYILTAKAQLLCGMNEGLRDVYAHKFKLNDDFDCPYYKRKWWKFWVKEE
jgi:hypothetical protein